MLMQVVKMNLRIMGQIVPMEQIHQVKQDYQHLQMQLMYRQHLQMQRHQVVMQNLIIL
ncbi:MAG: hypothetical protein IJZ96_10560 [Lachnospiraceae bacterium]|nr:hypothetical protein [Lachnospiraceae bacterium]